MKIWSLPKELKHNPYCMCDTVPFGMSTYFLWVQR